MNTAYRRTPQFVGMPREADVPLRADRKAIPLLLALPFFKEQGSYALITLANAHLKEMNFTGFVNDRASAIAVLVGVEKL